MDMVIASPALGDIDKDGYLEIVVGGQSGIYAWHYDGTPVSGWPQYPGGIISSKSIVLADIDQDGYVEVVLQSSGKIYVWRHDGTALPWSPYVFNCIYCDGAQSPIVGDIDGDGKMEIVAMVASWFLGNSWPQNEEFGGRTVHKLIAINDDGTAVLNWTKYVPSGPSPPLMADIDQDGNTEIIIGGSGVFIWDIPVPYSMDSVEWPAYRHDWRRTGNYSPRLPDLVIESLTHSPANPTAADLITFTAVVKNIGSGAAGASILAFKVGGESTPSIYSVPALPPKQTYAVQRQETLGVAQNYMNTVTVDVNSEVQETNEANNQEIEYYTVSPASNDYEKPQAIILSPTRDSLTDADMLTVTGTATDNIGIASVTVNGVAAVSSDGFAIWSAVVPLNPGNNTLTVIVRDVSGNVVIADSVLVNRQRNLIVNPISVALDSTNNRALVIPTDPTETLKNLLAVDLNTGERTVISGEGVGTGIEFGAPQDVVLDSASNRVLMTDWVLHGVISVDLPTGNRSIISDSTHGTGPYLNGPRNLALDAANNLVLVTDSDWFNPPALIAVELLTGNRSVISSSTTGEGPNFSFPRGVVLDQANHRAFVTDPGSQALYAVDLFNGNRTVISNNAGFGTGPGFSYPNELAFDSARNRVLVVDPNVEAVIAVDLLTGNRVIVSGQSMGTGPRISDSFDIALNTSTGMAFVVDQDLDALVSVDPSTGSRAIVSGMAIGSGSTFRAPSGIAVDSNNERAFVADFGLDALVVVDMINGSRTVISDAATGTGPQFSDPYGIVYDASNNRVLAVDGSLRALLAVDLGNGNRTILSGASTGSGPAFGLPSGLVYDPDSNHAFVTDVDLNAVVAVDLGMGQRTVISNAATGSGELLSRPAGIALHPAGDRVIVGNNATNKLIAVELTTGNRTVISDDTTGIGPTFSSEGYMGDLAIDSTNGRALVAVGVGTLFAVDLVTGNRSIISGPNKGKGIEYGGISHIAFDSVHRTVVVTDSVLEGLTLIEMGSGDRVIISK
jgi:sugar lactone lactonase YvrE